MNSTISFSGGPLVVAPVALVPTMAWFGGSPIEPPRSAAHSAPRLPEAIGEFLAAKRTAGRRAVTLKNLRTFLARFATEHDGKTVAEITLADVQSCADAQHSAWGRSTAINLLSSFFSFAVRRKWIDENPCRRIERITIELRPPRILTPGECRRLLNAASPQVRPWIAVCLFAGLRPSEAERLDWSAFRLDGPTPCVVVDAAASKVRRRRIVPLEPAAVVWLKVDAKTAGRLVSSNSVLRRHRAKAIRAARLSWSQDVLRHTCASMRIAVGHPIDRVAMELGNSVGILLRHYRELASAEDAEAFWRIRPDS